jgi:Coenzyme PQQ synthesis protein D (PqqD)
VSSENGEEGITGEVSPVTDATIISRSPNVLTAEVDGEVLMMSIDRGGYFSLNNVGSDIWRRLDPPCSFAELIDKLAAEYQATRATIAEDVRTWLTRMAAENIVRLA